MVRDISVGLRRKLFEGRVFSLWKETLRLPNHTEVEVDVVRHPGAAAVVPFLDRRTVLLIRQYRHAVGDVIWEVPAGTLNPGEEPLACALRELEEETGYRAAQCHFLGRIYPLPAYSDECIHLFLARDLAPGKASLEEDELLDLHRIPWDQALGMIREGTIRDAKTISALHLAGDWIREGGRL